MLEDNVRVKGTITNKRANKGIYIKDKGPKSKCIEDDKKGERKGIRVWRLLVSFLYLILGKSRPLESPAIYVI